MTPGDAVATQGASVDAGTGRRHVRHLGLALGVLAVAIFVIGTIGPPLFGRGVFLASDFVNVAYPWREVADPATLDYAEHGVVTDTVDSAYPAKATFGTAARDGEYRTWNPWVAGGSPLAPATSGVMGPLAGSAFVAFPAWMAPAIEKAGQLLVAIAFTFLFCRRLALQRAPALFAGIAFAGSGFMVMWSNWEQTDVAAMIPVLFWASERLLQRRKLVDVIPLAIGFAAMLLGFFPAVAFYALYVLVPYVAVRLLYEQARPWGAKFRDAARIGTGLVAGLGLAAFAVAPFVDQLLTRDVGDREAGSINLGLISLATTVAPRALGLSTDLDSDYSGPMNQVEAISFLGMTTVLLALVAACLPTPRGLPRGVRGVLVGATLVLGVATYGGGPVLAFLQNFPAFDNSFIGRTRSVLGFLVAVLAAIGAQALLERAPLRGRWPLVRTGVVAAATAVLAAVVLWRVKDLVPPPPRVTVGRQAFVLPVLVGVAACGSFWLLRSRQVARQSAAMAAVIGLLLVESLAFAVPLLPNERRSSLYPVTPGIEFLQDEAVGERVAPGGSRTLFDSATALFQVRNTLGHTFYETTWKEMLQAADPRAFALSATHPSFATDSPAAASPALDRLGVRWWVNPPVDPPFGEREAAGLVQASCDTPVDVGATAVPVDLPAGDGVRAVVLKACDVVDVPVDARLAVEVDGGAAVGRRELPGQVGPAEWLVGLPADDLTLSDDTPATLALENGAGAAVSVAANPEGVIGVDVVRADDDGLRLRYADDLFVYERVDGLPRIRWASEVEVVEDEDERLDLLASGDLPASAVVVDEAVSLADEPSTGQGGDTAVDVVTDDPETIRVRVAGGEAGLLVVADALQNGWVATVDGKSAPLVDADHAGVAVPVPSGEHEVVLRREVPGAVPGTAVTLLTVVALVGLVYWSRRRPAEGVQ